MRDRLGAPHDYQRSRVAAMVLLNQTEVRTIASFIRALNRARNGIFPPSQASK